MESRILALDGLSEDKMEQADWWTALSDDIYRMNQMDEKDERTG